ncbi:MAG: HD-GYP domain-containing protein [Planctomycetes bacterium]|nr:HD-GYP domain-containing protein [Planctomycetota bacterium]
MNDQQPKILGTSATVPTMTGRCRQLGLPVWQWDHRDQLVSEPDGWGSADAWLRSPRMRELLSRSTAGWPGAASPEVVEVIPGCWLLPIVGEPAVGDATILAAMAIGPDSLHGEAYEALCRSAGADATDARMALEPLARHRREDVDHWARVLRWMHEDMLRVDDDTHTISTFSKQLIESYEQMSLLYRVGELMNDLSDPKGFVNMACELLLTTLEFQWIAVRFSSLTALGRGLINELILTGQIPCSHTRYDRLAGEIVSQRDADARPEVLEEATSELARIVGSEVFVNPLLCDSQLAGVVIAGSKNDPDPHVSSNDMQLISATADFMGAFLHNSSMYSEQRTTFLGIINALSASIDAKDQYTRGHSERVAHLASKLSRAIGMNDEQAERVRLAGVLHDMGKIGVPEAVLLKPGRLTDEEFEAIKKHPTIGYNILKDIEPLQDVLPGVLYHHERWDGGGYPQGLRGSRIPLIGRILAVADAFDAMSSDRAYRPRIARETVLREMQLGAGAQWDHELVKVFLSMDLSSYDNMIERHAAQDSMAA